MNNLERIVNAIRVSIDATSAEETDLIADLNRAVELLTRYNSEEIWLMVEQLRFIEEATTCSPWIGRAGDLLSDLIGERERV